MGRVIAIFLCATLFSPSVSGQEPNVQQHTLELNLTSFLTYTSEIIYTFHSQGAFGFRGVAGYSFNSGEMSFTNSSGTIDRKELTGYYFKAGPEIGIYEGDLKKLSIALLPFYGSGNTTNHIKIEYPLGIYRAEENYNYTIYGASAHFGYTVWSGYNWFSAVAMEYSVVNARSANNPAPPRAYPGLGSAYVDISSNTSGYIRIALTIGYIF